MSKIQKVNFATWSNIDIIIIKVLIVKKKTTIKLK